MEEHNRNPFLYYGIKWSRDYYEKKLNNPAYLSLDEHFPEHKILENNWELIRDEAIELLKKHALPEFHDVDKGQEFISNNDGKKWNIYVMKLYGKWVKTNSKRLPKTYKLLKGMKSVTTVNLSVLAPGKHIPAHRGPYKGILRYQLALEVPKEEKCRIYVDGKPHYWKEGKGVLFDDTYMHEVKNETNEHRIALLLDVKRKKMPTGLKWFDHLFYKMIQLGISINGAKRKAVIE